jgi:hypothetical protein
LLHSLHFQWTSRPQEANCRHVNSKGRQMAQTTEPKRSQPPDPVHYAESSARENLIEHVFLGELLRGLWRKNVRDLEVLRPEVDSGGYDLALEFRGLTRHVQLKSSYSGARRADVTASVKLLERPSACILWIFFDPETLSLGPFLWFGSAPGEKMPLLGEKIARHTKPNAALKKADRPAHRVIAKSRFAKLETIDAVIQKLIGGLTPPRGQGS